jgi:2-phosphosulfolactate phosphatase
MKVIKTRLIHGARKAEGLVVIIDVFRAFSCTPLFFYYGAKEVLMVADRVKAETMKREIPGAVLVGEHNEVPLKSADLGNSPSLVMRHGEPLFKGRTVVHRTTAGVTGAACAMKSAQEIILGSFVMAKSIVAYILDKTPEKVTLVAMGERAKKKAPEDEACADYMEHLLLGSAWEPIPAMEALLFQPTAQKFLSGDKSYLPPEDPVFCLQRDIFDTVFRVEEDSRGMVVRQIPAKSPGFCL